MLLCAQAKQSKGAMTEMTAGPTALGGGDNFAARAELARVAAALEALASLENLGDGDGGGGDGGGGDGGGGCGGEDDVSADEHTSECERGWRGRG